MRGVMVRETVTFVLFRIRGGALGSHQLFGKACMIDHLIRVFDRGLRTVAGIHPVTDDIPDAPTTNLSDPEKRRSGSLMRVNHTGEVCAQALYEGQALTARDVNVRSSLRQAAKEEVVHLVWCRKRLEELDTHPSVLDPIFFATSCALGALTGALGDRVSLGFIAATEDQVVEHLDRHIDQLPQGDGRSRAILERMREDELRHGTSAEKAGGLPFPMPIRRLMTSFSRIMTETTYRI